MGTTIALGCAAVVLGGSAPAAMAADNCPNAEFRVGPSALLPDCRAYELVSPADKDGYSLAVTASVGVANTAYGSASGDQAHFAVPTPFANPKSGGTANLVSTRTTSGWRTRNVNPRYCGPDASGGAANFLVAGFSADFASTFVIDPAGSNCAVDDHAGADVYLVDPDGNVSWQSHNGAPKTDNVAATAEAISADGKQLVFSSPEKLVQPLESSRSTGMGLYHRSGGEVVPVGLGNDGSLLNACGAVIAGHPGDMYTVGRMSSDGRVIYFHSGANEGVPGCSAVTDDGGQLYARVDATRTILISESQLASPETRRNPSFLGATPDGRYAFFSSTERLTEEATPGGGIYRYDLTAVLSGASAVGELQFLTPTLTAAPFGLVGRQLAAISEDGESIAFVASGILHPDASGSGNKLYVARGSEVRFVAAWIGDTFVPAADVSMSPNGRRLAYPGRPGGATHKHVMLFSGTGDHVCVSCPPDGAATKGDARFAPQGAGQSPSRSAQLGLDRYVTDDGRVFFSSPERLVVRDVNDRYDVYQWDSRGRVLLSGGQGPYDSWLMSVSRNARDVFFVTNDSLVSEDFDNGDQDLYVARVGGGFPQSTGDSAPCVGDACQGGVVGAPGMLLAGTAGYIGAGNIPAPPVKRDNDSSSKLSLVKGSRSLRGTEGYLRVRVSGEGKVRTSGSGLRRTTRSVTRSGTTYRIPVRLSTRAKRMLGRRGRVRVRVTVRFTPEGGKRRTERVRVTFREKGSSSRSKSRAKRSTSGERTASVGAASDQKGGR